MTGRYDAALLDLDGVVYIGPHAVPAAPPAISRAREAGMRVAFVTNNASRPPATVAEHLTALGVPAQASDVVTSAQAAARLIAERFPPGSPVLVVGDMGLRLALRAHRLRPVTAAADRPVAVVQGYSPRTTYQVISEAVAAVHTGALFVATNTDLTAPSPRGLMPGNGALCRLITEATGRQPVVAGKPQRPLHREGMLRTRASRPLVVGDRLDTDIEGAHNGSADSLLVLSGVATPLQAVLAPPNRRPTYLGRDLGALNEPHPVPEPVAGGRVCGGWTATVDGAAPALRGAGDPLDGLRALCAAVWESGTEVDPTAAARVVGALALP
nr:HAD-IIA family hydrolase [Allonocardiopsis opalescens]